VGLGLGVGVEGLGLAIWVDAIKVWGLVSGVWVLGLEFGDSDFGFPDHGVGRRATTDLV